MGRRAGPASGAQPSLKLKPLSGLDRLRILYYHAVIRVISYESA